MFLVETVDVVESVDTDDPGANKNQDLFEKKDFTLLVCIAHHILIKTSHGIMISVLVDADPVQSTCISSSQNHEY